jgi:hypothetical protein
MFFTDDGEGGMLIGREGERHLKISFPLKLVAK